MRLIISHAYSVKGGVEKVIVSLVKEIAALIDKVIFVLPEREVQYFQKLIPSSEKIEYVSFSWGKEEKTLKAKISNNIYNNARRIKKILKILPSDRVLARIEKVELDEFFQRLIKKHKATHCLYMITAGQSPPNIQLPLAVIIYDFYWHFCPEKYSYEFRRLRDSNFKEWGRKADILFTISNATRKTAMKAFPAFSSKLKAVPLACNPLKRNKENEHVVEGIDSKESVFFYPASHNSYQKNFVTLFKAAKKLTQKGLNFKIVISGRNVEELISDTPSEGKGNRDELAREYYQENRELLKPHIQILGFCPREKISQLYKSCKAVVLPSSYEGFGLPLIESLVSGSPVICSDIEVFKEQISLYSAQDLVQIFEVNDDGELSRKMEEAINNPKREVSVERVEKLISRRTWTDVAKEYVKTLESIKK